MGFRPEKVKNPPEWLWAWSEHIVGGMILQNAGVCCRPFLGAGTRLHERGADGEPAVIAHTLLDLCIEPGLIQNAMLGSIR